MTDKDVDHLCKSLTKAGKPCRAAATEGGLCFFHANPNKASELGRIGGRRKCNHAAENPDPLPALNNAMAVRNTVARLINDLYEGRLHPRVAAGLGPLMNLQLRAIETTDLEQRLTRMESKVEKLAATDKAAGTREGKRGIPPSPFSPDPTEPEATSDGNGQAQSTDDAAVREEERYR